MSLAVPITNSMTFIFSLFTGLLLGEELGGKGKKGGSRNMVIGFDICILDRYLAWYGTRDCRCSYMCS